MALFVFLLMLYVSQSAAVRVKVYKGDESVTLPFTVSGMDMKDPSALWTREGSTPETVHRRDEAGDDLRKQSPQFKGRTEMKERALQIGDLSLTLTHPNASDTGVYTCVVKDGITEVRRITVELMVISKQVTAVEGVESVSMPCTMRPLNISKDPSAQWTREGSEVHLRVKEGDKEKDDLRLQSAQFRGCTQMNERALQTGDLSLVLKNPTPEHSGIYTCTVMEGNTQTGRMVVKLYSVEVNIEPIPPPRAGPIIAGVVVPLVLLVGLLNGLFVWYYRKNQRRPKGRIAFVYVDEEDESVSLPFTLGHGLDMRKDSSVLWTREGLTPDTVHHRVKQLDDLRKQNPQFKDRTKMKPDPLQTGDLSLDLRHPTVSDTGTYLCVVREGTTEVERITVELIVMISIAYTVPTNEGAESVSLYFTLKHGLDMMKDPSVLWTRKGSRHEEVHLRVKEGDDLDNQSPRFINRTEMRPDALQTGDFSLVLKNPTASDSGVYTCEVRDGTTVVGRGKEELMVSERIDANPKEEEPNFKSYPPANEKAWLLRDPEGTSTHEYE